MSELRIVALVCPVCNGAGKISRPPWVAGDVLTWTAGDPASHNCTACKGEGIFVKVQSPVVEWGWNSSAVAGPTGGDR